MNVCLPQSIRKSLRLQAFWRECFQMEMCRELAGSENSNAHSMNVRRSNNDRALSLQLELFDSLSSFSTVVFLSPSHPPPPTLSPLHLPHPHPLPFLLLRLLLCFLSVAYMDGYTRHIFSFIAAWHPTCLFTFGLCTTAVFQLLLQ